MSKKHFRFDVVIGNPPYQTETLKSEDSNTRQKPVTNIFQLFQEEADKLATNNIALIYPGGRWIHQFGKGCREFGQKQINDTHLQEILYYPDANEVFDGVQIADGISVVIKKMDKKEDGFKYVYIKDGQEQEIEMDNPGDKLMPLNPDDIRICAKIDKTVKERNLKFMAEGILPRSLFKIESNFVEENPERVLPYTAGIAYDKEKYIKLLTNDKAGKMGRATWFLADRDVIETNRNYVSEWQVVVSSANAGGQKRDNQLAIIDNNSAFGRSRVALKSFATRDEAVNFHNYVCSNLVKYAFLMTDESLTSLGKRVPDILNYKSQEALIDFHGDINQQLYQLFGFTEAETSYIEQTVLQFSKSQSKEVR